MKDEINHGITKDRTHTSITNEITNYTNTEIQ